MSDLISRQAAIETVRKCAVKEVTPAYMLIDKAEAMTELMMLPSAQPEPCEDAVSRQDAIRVASGFCHPANIAKELAKLPSAQPELPEWAQKVEEYRKIAPKTFSSPIAWALYQTWREYAERRTDEQTD